MDEMLHILRDMSHILEACMGEITFSDTSRRYRQRACERALITTEISGACRPALGFRV